MPFFSKKPSSSRGQVKIVKAVNGGSVGQSERQKQLSSASSTASRRSRQRQSSSQSTASASNQQQQHTRRMDDFWMAIDECEFILQDPASTPVMKEGTGLLLGERSRRRRQYSSETYRTRQSSTQTNDSRSDYQQRDPQELEDFWGRGSPPGGLDEETPEEDHESLSTLPHTQSVMVEEVVDLTPRRKIKRGGFFRRNFLR